VAAAAAAGAGDVWVPLLRQLVEVSQVGHDGGRLWQLQRPICQEGYLHRNTGTAACEHKCGLKQSSAVPCIEDLAAMHGRHTAGPSMAMHACAYNYRLSAAAITT
jgi:hypothetical protein